MLCQKCQERTATVEFSQVINHQKITLYLCDVCVENEGAMFTDFSPSLDISSFLGSLFNGKPSVRISQTLRCNTCGLTYEKFSEHGKLGCTDCYTVFYEPLRQTLKKIHGNNAHVGKVPKKNAGVYKFKRELDGLKTALFQAVQSEEYEKAATLRDQVRELEAQMNGGDGA